MVRGFWPAGLLLVGPRAGLRTPARVYSSGQLGRCSTCSRLGLAGPEAAVRV